MGNGGAQDGSARDDEEFNDGDSVVDELTGLANRRGFMEILRLEERRHARYGGSPILVLVDVRRVMAKRAEAERPELLVEIAATIAEAMRDTDTVARVDDDRFAILAIQAGCSGASIVGRLRLQLEIGRIQGADVTVGEPGSLVASWRALEGTARPTLRLV
jgi:diguanylate cyclase (GGDEF)-like protein